MTKPITEGRKNNAMILAIVLPLIGLLGIGQLYIGKVKEGIALLFIGIIVFVIGFEVQSTTFGNFGSVSGAIIAAMAIYVITAIISIIHVNRTAKKLLEPDNDDSYYDPSNQGDGT